MILDEMEQLRALDVVRRKALDNDVTPDRAQEDDALCITQAKKIYEWGNEACPHWKDEQPSLKHTCIICWQTLGEGK